MDLSMMIKLLSSERLKRVKGYMTVLSKKDPREIELVLTTQISDPEDKQIQEKALAVFLVWMKNLQTQGGPTAIKDEITTMIETLTGNRSLAESISNLLQEVF